MARPRIVHVYKDVYPPVEGGIERTIYHMVRLTRNAFEPVIVCAAHGARSSVRDIADGIEVREVGSWGRMLSTPVAPGFIKALRRSRADLFHFHFPHPTGELAYLLSGLKTPAVATYHSDVVRQKTAMLAYGPFQRRFLARMTVIMPTSQRYLETSKTLAAHRDRCRVVPLGLPTEDYATTPAIESQIKQFKRQWGDYIFFIGCLRAYKGLPYLLTAMREMPQTQLVIAGEGREGDRLKRQAEAEGLVGRVHFLGRVDQATAIALFHGAAVFCLPAHQRSEAFGLCQIEAMACGLPVVSTDLPTGVPEVNQDKETGLIVPPADPAALAGALRSILQDEAMREEMGRAGHRRAAQHFSDVVMAESVSRIYNDVLHEAPHSIGD